MSSDTAAGRSSRRILVIAAAVFAAAVMLAVPVFAAADTYADLTKDEAGFCVKATDPTDAQLASAGLTSRSYMIVSVIDAQLQIFNDAVLGVPVADAESLKITEAEGDKVNSDSTEMFELREVFAEKAVITYTATSNGELIDPDTSYMNDKTKEAAAAVKAYLGNDVSVGDTVTITGTINSRASQGYEFPYRMLDGDKCIMSGITFTEYFVQDIDVTITLKHAGTEKSVKYVSDAKGTFGGEAKYEFQGDTVEVGTKYTVKSSVTSSYKGDAYYTVDGKDYSVIEGPTVTPDHEETVLPEDIVAQSSVAVSPLLKAEIASLPQSTDNMTVDKTYEGAESVYDDLILDAVGDDLMKLLLIIGGVILGIIVLVIVIVIVVVVVLRKKKA